MPIRLILVPYLVVAFVFLYLLAYIVGRFKAEEKAESVKKAITENRNWFYDRIQFEELEGVWFIILLGAALWPLTTVVGIVIAIVWSLVRVMNIPVSKAVGKVVYEQRAAVITSPVEPVRKLGDKYLKGKKDSV